MILTLTLALLLSQDEVKAGFGAVDITPEVGASIPGGFRPNPSKGIRDPLYAVACVVTDGRTPVALVGIDELFIGKRSVQQARERIEKNTKIPGANVLVAGSAIFHTPDYRAAIQVLRDGAAGAARGVVAI